MSLSVGDFVDYTAKRSEAWHGIIVKLEGQDVWVLWLMADVSRDHSPLSAQKNAYYRGYTTIHSENDLALCQRSSRGSWTGPKHPLATNPWGEKYGMTGGQA
jgi:hypothetical protein